MEKKKIFSYLLLLNIILCSILIFNIDNSNNIDNSFDSKFKDNSKKDKETNPLTPESALNDTKILTGYNYKNIFNKTYLANVSLMHNGVRGYWKFNNNYNDSSIYNNSMIPMYVGSPPTFVPGKLNYSVYLDGEVNDQYLTTNYTIDITRENHSFSLWFNSSNVGTLGKDEILVDMNINATSCILVWLESTTETVHVTYVDGVTTLDYKIQTQPLIPNKWYHLIGVYDTTINNLTLYLNGSIDMEVSGITKSSNAPSGTIEMGNDYGGSDKYFDGRLDEFIIWNKTLKGCEPSCLWNYSYGQELDDILVNSQKQDSYFSFNIDYTYINNLTIAFNFTTNYTLEPHIYIKEALQIWNFDTNSWITLNYYTVRGNLSATYFIASPLPYLNKTLSTSTNVIIRFQASCIHEYSFNLSMVVTANANKEDVSLLLEDETVEFGDDVYEEFLVWFNGTVYDYGNETWKYYNVTFQTQVSGFDTIWNKTADFVQYTGSITKINVSVNYTFYIKEVWRYRYKVISDRGTFYTDWVFFEVVRQPPQNPNNFFRIEIHNILNKKKLAEQEFSRISIEGYCEASDYQKYIVRLNWINLTHTWDYDSSEDDRYELITYPSEQQIMNDGEFISFETIEVYGNSFFTIDGIWMKDQFLIGATNYKFGQLMPFGYDLTQYPSLSAPDQPYTINFSVYPLENDTFKVTHLFEAKKSNLKSTNYEIECANFPYWVFHNVKVTIYTTTKYFGQEPATINIDLTEKQETFNFLWIKKNAITFTYNPETTSPGSLQALNELTGNVLFTQSINLFGVFWETNYSKELQYLFPEPNKILTGYEIRKELRIFSRGEEISTEQFQIEFVLNWYRIPCVLEYPQNRVKFNLTGNTIYSYPYIWNSTLEQNSLYYVNLPFRFPVRWNHSNFNIYYDNILIKTVNFSYDNLDPFIDVVLPDFYNPKQVYFGLYNYDGLGLESELFKFYLNDSRADFGFNLIRGSHAKVLVTDYFDIIMFSNTIEINQSVDEYDIQVTVYKLIINNNFSRGIEIHIERSGLNQEIVQSIPSMSGIELRLIPNVTYILKAYELNGTFLGKRKIYLDEDNTIVNFGFFKIDVPIDPKPMFNSLMSLIFFILYYTIFFIIVIIIFIRFKGNSVQRRDKGFNLYGIKNKKRKPIKRKKLKNRPRGTFNYEE